MNLVFDIEADGLNPNQIFCIVAIDVDTLQIYKYDIDHIKEGILFLSKASKLIGHNIIGYDIPVINRLWNNYDPFSTTPILGDIPIVDTLVLSRLFNPTREGGHGLESWGYRLNYIKGDYKHSEDAWDNYCPEMLEYCIRDVKLNRRVYEALKKESKGFSRQSVKLEHDVAAIINQQREDGFLLDVKAATMLSAELNDKLVAVTKDVQDTFKPKTTYRILRPSFTKDGSVSRLAKDLNGEGARLTEEEHQIMIQNKEVRREFKKSFNLGSRKQIGDYLMSVGWKPKKFTNTGQPIVDEPTLLNIKDIPEAKKIASFLTLQKRVAQINSWIKLVEDHDDRVHGYVNSNGAVTGRMTHSYPNMAQIPGTYSPYGKECRSCWIVPKGYKLVGIDASQLELRCLAHYMNDRGYVDEIINGDIHTTNQNLARLESRNQAKTFIYALIYGAGDEKLGTVVGRGRKSGKELRERFSDNLPSFKALKDRVAREAKKGYVKGLDGRKLKIRFEHAALNTLLQGAGAIIMKQALTIFNNDILSRGLDARFVANVHDEWQLEVREDQASFVGELGVKALRAATAPLNLDCPLDGEYNVGTNWAETH
jgi:DNA polymerase I-like protein with 3'-5' exonuclease and polymerase domains